jgi:hypothetical protein
MRNPAQNRAKQGEKQGSNLSHQILCGRQHIRPRDTQAAVAALIAAISEPNERAAAVLVLREHGRAVRGRGASLAS